jgi:hypothetical protein
MGPEALGELKYVSQLSEIRGRGNALGTRLIWRAQYHGFFRILFKKERAQ